MYNGPKKRIRGEESLVENGLMLHLPGKDGKVIASTYQGGQAGLDKTEGCLYYAVSCYWLTGSLDGDIGHVLELARSLVCFVSLL